MKAQNDEPALRKAILKTLRFYDALGKPLTSIELYRALLPLTHTHENFEMLWGALEKLTQTKEIHTENGFYSLKSMEGFSAPRRSRDVVLHKKWKKFLRYQKLFGYIPFVDFTFGAGSLALGNVNDDSDFDVIMGCEQGRIFTVRFFAIVFFGMLGIRRKRIEHKETARDKVCFNHFVTPSSYKLQSPYHLQWCALYANLVPLYGDLSAMRAFLKANSWVRPAVLPLHDLRFLPTSENPIRLALSAALRGKAGDWLETIFKRLQVYRIRQSLPNEIHEPFPRLRYDDNELEFHPDLSKIQRLLDTLRRQE